MLSIKSCQAEGRHIGQITQEVLILGDGIQLSLQAAGSWRIKGSGLLDTDREVIYSIHLVWNRLRQLQIYFCNTIYQGGTIGNHVVHSGGILVNGDIHHIRKLVNQSVALIPQVVCAGAASLLHHDIAIQASNLISHAVYAGKVQFHIIIDRANLLLHLLGSILNSGSIALALADNSLTAGSSGGLGRNLGPGLIKILQGILNAVVVGIVENNFKLAIVGISAIKITGACIFLPILTISINIAGTGNGSHVGTVTNNLWSDSGINLRAPYRYGVCTLAGITLCVGIRNIVAYCFQGQSGCLDTAYHGIQTCKCTSKHNVSPFSD